MGRGRSYTEADDQYIRDNYALEDKRVMARYLGRRLEAVYKRARKLGVGNPLKRWTEREDTILRNRAGTCRILTLAQDLDRCPGEISSRGKILGLGSMRKRRTHTSGGHEIKGAGRKENGVWQIVLTHRAVVEANLGRRLDSAEIVHHINGDKTDNRLENLWVCDRSTHKKAHGSIEGLLRTLMENGFVVFDKSTGRYVLKVTEKN